MLEPSKNAVTWFICSLGPKKYEDRVKQASCLVRNDIMGEGRKIATDCAYHPSRSRVKQKVGRPRIRLYWKGLQMETYRLRWRRSVCSCVGLRWYGSAVGC